MSVRCGRSSIFGEAAFLRSFASCSRTILRKEGSSNMKNVKRIALVLALFLIAVLGLGCAPQGAAGSAAVTDMLGREVKLSAPAKKIVAVNPADCEILYLIGAGDTLVGRGEYCNYPEEVASVPAVQSGSETNVEQIIALEPQLVIMSTMAQSSEQVETLENAGIPVYVSDAATIDQVYQNIEHIGQLTGKTTEAEAAVEDMKKAFASISEKAGGAEGKTIYFEVSPLEYGLWTAGTGTFMDEIATMLGLQNAFNDVQGWGEVSEEQVLARDPVYIVTVGMYLGEGPTPVEEILSRTVWQSLKAIKSSNVVSVDSDEISRPGPRLADAAQAICDFVYGE